jgi:hypothetical protein
LHVWKRSAYRVVAGKYEGKSLSERPNCRREDNIKMHLQETEWKIADWVHLAEDRYQ